MPPRISIAQQAVLPATAAGKIDVGRGVGRGRLVVVRSRAPPPPPPPSSNADASAGLPSQYSSVTAIRSGEVAEDLNYFLAEVLSGASCVQYMYSNGPHALLGL